MQRLNENIKDKIFNFIKRKEDRKRRKHIFPAFVLHSDIHTFFGFEPYDYLNALYKEGKILYHRTLNQYSYNIKKKEKI